MAGNDVFLYSGEANPNDVKLSDPTTAGGAVAYTLSVDAGSYTITGFEATLNRVEVTTPAKSSGGGRRYGHSFDFAPATEPDNDDEEVMLAVIKEFVRIAA